MEISRHNDFMRRLPSKVKGQELAKWRTTPDLIEPFIEGLRLAGLDVPGSDPAPGRGAAQVSAPEVARDSAAGAHPSTERRRQRPREVPPSKRDVPETRLVQERFCYGLLKAEGLAGPTSLLVGQQANSGEVVKSLG